MSGAKARRRAGLRFGAQAEWIAALWLQLKFYRILARRFRIREGEIDIIAQRGQTIIFVEVKARGALDDALIAITPEKGRRFSRAVAAWLAVNPWAVTHTLRGDAVFVAPRRLPRHFVDAIKMRIW